MSDSPLCASIRHNFIYIGPCGNVSIIFRYEAQLFKIPHSKVQEPQPAMLAFCLARKKTDEPLWTSSHLPEDVRSSSSNVKRCYSHRRAPEGRLSSHLANLTLRLLACVITVSDWDKKVCDVVNHKW